jgi:hypothetical protein
MLEKQGELEKLFLRLAYLYTLIESSSTYYTGLKFTGTIWSLQCQHGGWYSRIDGTTPESVMRLAILMTEAFIFHDESDFLDWRRRH